MIPTIILIIVVGLALLYLSLLWRYSHWSRKGVKQGNPFKLFGDMNDSILSQTDYLTTYNTLNKRYSGSPFCGVYNFFLPCLFVRDHELAKDVMSRKFPNFQYTPYEIKQDVDPIMSHDPFFRRGDEWKEARKDFSSLMTPARLRLMFPRVADAASRLLEYLRDINYERKLNDGLEMKGLASKFVTETLVATLLGVQANTFKDEDNIFEEIGRNVFEEETFERNLAMLSMIGAPHIAKLLKLRLVPRKAADLLFRVVLNEAQRRAANGNEIRNDVLETLLQKTARNKNTENVNNHFVVSLIGSFFVEGFHTTALAIAFTLFELAKNLEVQDELRGEIKQIAPVGTEFTHEAISGMTFLQNCFKEAMRLHPPQTLVQRLANEDVTLKAETGEEIFLKRGSTINIPIAALQRDPRQFPHPDKYDPARFTDEIQNRNFLSFGEGPRQCVGMKFAQQAAHVMVAAVVREYRVELSPRMKLPIKFASHPFFLVPKDGVWLRLVPLEYEMEMC